MSNVPAMPVNTAALLGNRNEPNDLHHGAHLVYALSMASRQQIVNSLQAYLDNSSYSTMMHHQLVSRNCRKGLYPERRFSSHIFPYPYGEVQKAISYCKSHLQKQIYGMGGSSRSSRLISSCALPSRRADYPASRPLSCTFGTKSSSIKSRDTRLAGRKRFYKVVGTAPVSPPWEQNIGLNEKSTDGAIGNGNRASTADIKTHLIQLYTPTRDRIEKNAKGDCNKIGSRRQNFVPSSESSWYGVTLDGRQLRTPIGTLLSVPSQSLASALALEWDSQKTHITPTQMPLMTLVCTALDHAILQRQRRHLIDTCLSFLSNDTTCYFADPMEDRILYGRQKGQWDELHRWVQENVFQGLKPAIAVGTGEALIRRPLLCHQSNKMAAESLSDEISSPQSAKSGFGGLPHAKEIVDISRRYLEQLDVWHLTAIQSVAMEGKSFFIGMGLVEGLYHNKLNDAILSCRIEEEYQIEQWGLVEGGHDYDRLNCQVQIGAAQCMLSMIHMDRK